MPALAVLDAAPANVMARLHIPEDARDLCTGLQTRLLLKSSVSDTPHAGLTCAAQVPTPCVLSKEVWCTPQRSIQAHRSFTMSSTNGGWPTKAHLSSTHAHGMCSLLLCGCSTVTPENA